MSRLLFGRLLVSLVAIAALLAPAAGQAPALAAPAGAITWTVDHDAKTITVKVKIQIYSGCSGGDAFGGEASACELPRSMLHGPTQLLADRIKRSIERIWNKPYHYYCYELKAEVDVKLGTDQSHVDTDRIGVRIDPSPTPIRSYVHVAPRDRSQWRSDDPADRIEPENGGAETTWAEDASPRTYAHEFGHLIGLHDAYRDALTNVPGEVVSVPLQGAPIDLMSSSSWLISQETINRVVRRNFPQMHDTSGKPVAEDDIKCDYRGDFGGNHLSGSIKYCGKVEHPYWGADIVGANGDRAFLSFLIPPGSETPVIAEITVPFVTDYNKYLDGTGSFIPGDPPHFLIDIADGVKIVTLEEGTFCNYDSP